MNRILTIQYFRRDDLQQMVAGADALLNFAARATTLLPKFSLYDNNNQQPQSSAATSPQDLSKPTPQKLIYITQYNDTQTKSNFNKRQISEDADDESKPNKRSMIESPNGKVTKVRKVINTKHIVTQFNGTKTIPKSSLNTISKTTIFDNNNYKNGGSRVINNLKMFKSNASEVGTKRITKAKRLANNIQAKSLSTKTSLQTRR